MDHVGDLCLFFVLFQVSAVLAGLSVQQDHWRDNTLRKQETLSHSANRIWLTAQLAMEITVVRVDLWITPSGKRRKLNISRP